MRWPHDSNLTLNVLLQIFVELSEVLKLSDKLSLQTDDFVFIEHVKIDNPGSYFYNMFHPANRVASTCLAKIEVTRSASSVNTSR